MADKSTDSAAEPSVQVMESEIEATRDHLAHTIDQLLYRVSPKTIAKREVGSVKATYVDDAGQVRTDNVAKTVGVVVAVAVVVVVLRKATR